MNLKELKKDIGTNFRLRPRPIRKTWRELLHARDDLWQLDDILDNPARLRLANVRTQRVIELQTDNVREYRTPDFLILRCQLIISGRELASRGESESRSCNG